MKLTGAGLLIVVYSGFIATVVTSHIYGNFKRDLNHQWKKRENGEIKCMDSKLMGNLSTKATYMKIVTNNGDTLLSVDSTNTDIRDLGQLLTFLFRPNLESQQKYIPEFFITRHLSKNGMNVRIANKSNKTLFEVEIEGSNEGLRGIDVKCVRLTEFKVTLDPTTDINHRDSYNMTPLLWAGLFGDEELAKNLIERGAKLNTDGRYVTLALMTTVDAGKDALLEYLINGGANVNEDFDGLTPLHIAARKDQLKCARILLNHGANVSSQDLFFSATPLFFAQHIEMIKELVSKGADIQTKAAYDMTPLHIAVFTGNEELINYYVQSGIDVNSKTKANTTPLIIAIQEQANEDKCLEIVKLLVERHNADVNIKDKRGNTALSWATRKGLNKVQDYLKAHGAM